MRYLVHLYKKRREYHKNSPHTIEELYTAVKKPKLCEPKDEPPPPNSVEELYTAVQKCSATKGEEEALPIPPQPEDSITDLWNNV